MATGRITKRSVDAIKVADRDQFLWDDEVSGFGLKVTPNDRRMYLLQYRMGGRGSPTRRYTIGRHGTWTPDEARTEAKRLRKLVDKGQDPQHANQQRQRAEVDLAFNVYLERFLRLYGEKEWSPRTFLSASSNLRRYVLPVLWDKKRKALPHITRSDVVAVFDALPPGKPALPRNVFAHARKLFSWAVERGDIERSPFDGMKSPPAVATRERVLTDEELRLVWEASYTLGKPFGAMVRVLMLTGQRRDEVAGLPWAELDRGNALWTIPGARTKNGETQLVPLTAEVITELDAIAGGTDWPRKGPVFTTNGKTPVSGFSKAKARLDEQMLKLARKQALDSGNDPADVEIAGWRLHDLRRTLATGMQRLGVRFEVTEALLNHVSGAKAGVAGVYQRHNWRDEKRTALEAWARHVQRVGNSKRPDNVVALRASEARR